MLKEFSLKGIVVGWAATLGVYLSMGVLYPSFALIVIKADVESIDTWVQMYFLLGVFLNGIGGVYFGSLAVAKARWINSLFIVLAGVFLANRMIQPGTDLGDLSTIWYELTCYCLCFAALVMGHQLAVRRVDKRLESSDCASHLSPCDIADKEKRPGTDADSVSKVSVEGILAGIVLSQVVAFVVTICLGIALFVTYRTSVIKEFMTNPSVIGLTMFAGLISTFAGGYVSMMPRSTTYLTPFIYGLLGAISGCVIFYLVQSKYAVGYEWIVVLSVVMTIPASMLGAQLHRRFDKTAVKASTSSS
ncbi:hypothetical protein L2750_15315 [Shewanella submarina]|uniref:DUF4386 domain-containing protein n=1 Tax=Shewanella submarina TaxID=2016376 RepID=A0ABV7G5L4_9GAMM|nr:hypothetical protein [Shewanella submarina]MCL1038502.1 hypothetical protein [Shewanella submarina]